MKKTLLLLLLVSTTLNAQVGIGTTNPNATLDIKASNIASPLGTDGILIPRVDNFPMPVNNPGVNQDGMLLFLTGNGTPAKGFYYWDNTLTSWQSVGGVANTNIPFVTRTELDAITTPQNGQMVYDSTDDVTLMWNGSNWIVLSDNCFPQPTIASAGSPQYFNDGTLSTTLTANTPIEGTGMWTVENGITSGGVFADATNPTTTFTGSPCTTYLLRWTITSACTTSFSETYVVFNQFPTAANAGADQIFTDGTTSVTLAANTPAVGTGEWSYIGLSGATGTFSNINDPNATFTGSACSKYYLYWKITACLTFNDVVIIQFNEQASIANAGLDQTSTDGSTSVTLAANTPANGTGNWSVITGSGGSFANPNDPNTTFSGNLCTPYRLRWTISACNFQYDDVNIMLSTPTPTISNAGTDIYSFSSTTVTLAANAPSVGTGMWSIVSGGTGTFVDATNPTTSFTADSNNSQYVLQWTTSTCTSSTDQVNIFFGNVIGQYAYGGIIFYIDATGTSGLLCAETTQGSQRWTCSNTNIVTNFAIGTGANNTTAIVGNPGTCGFSGNYAAKVCNNLTLNGFSDWFLPSRYELLELSTNRLIVDQTITANGGSILGSFYYWSSTQSNITNAYRVLFSNVTTNTTSKSTNNNVRAIRAF